MDCSWGILAVLVLVTFMAMESYGMKIQIIVWVVGVL